MPREYGLDDTPESLQGRACDGVRDDLSDCIMKSDCVKNGRLPSDCLRNPDDGVPDECLQLKTLMFECKRSLIDFRQRFRGKKGY